MQIQRSDAEIFGVEGGENYAPALSAHRASVMLDVHRLHYIPAKAQIEYAETFLRVPQWSEVWASQYETSEFLWLGERAA